MFRVNRKLITMAVVIVCQMVSNLQTPKHYPHALSIVGLLSETIGINSVYFYGEKRDSYERFKVNLVFFFALISEKNNYDTLCVNHSVKVINLLNVLVYEHTIPQSISSDRIEETEMAGNLS